MTLQYRVTNISNTGFPHYRGIRSLYKAIASDESANTESNISTYVRDYVLLESNNTEQQIKLSRG